MDEKPRNEVDEEETAESSDDSGPLGRLLEHSIGSGPAESEGVTQILNQPSQPGTVPADYAKGTHEHDDDREG